MGSIQTRICMCMSCARTDEHTHYVTLGPVDFPENGPYYFYGEEVTPPDSQDMKEYLCALAAQYAA